MVANIMCWLSQCSVFDYLKLVWIFFLLLSAIFRYLKIVYHVYADDIQRYISFNCKQPLEATYKIGQLCIGQ